jgi:alkylhydroperoxidase family enzyme
MSREEPMAWIPVVEYEDSDGALRVEYDRALQRAGRVYNILKLMSRRPAHLTASIDFYVALMHGPSSLTRAQREMLGVVVSQANHCHY